MTTPLPSPSSGPQTNAVSLKVDPNHQATEMTFDFKVDLDKLASQSSWPHTFLPLAGGCAGYRVFL